MCEEGLEQFAENILGDLAERRDEHGKRPPRGKRRVERVVGETRRIPLRGDHVCYQGQDHYRGSDRPFRLTMAVTAREKKFQLQRGKARGAFWRACLLTADRVLFSPLTCVRVRKSFGDPRPGSKSRPTRPASAGKSICAQSPKQTQATPLRGNYDPRFAELDRLIADTQRRGSRKRSLPPEVLRIARIIKSQVEKYRTTHENWEQKFNGWFGLFQAENCRDAEWYEGAEKVYRQRIEEAEETLHPSEGRTRPLPPRNIPLPIWERMVAHDLWSRKSDVAMAVVNLAHLFHEQGKFQEAEASYLRAMRLYESPLVAERVRTLTLPWIDTQIANCHSRTPPDARPVMWVVNALAGAKKPRANGTCHGGSSLKK